MKTSVGIVNLSCQEHKHNCYEIIFYSKGTGRFQLTEKSIPIFPGKFIIVPPDTVHASKYDSEAETIFIKGDFNHIFSFSSPTVVMDNAEKAGSFLVKMIFENRFTNPEYLSSLANALAHYLLQNTRTEKNISIVLKDIVTKISDNFYDSNINISEILKKSGYAEDYIRAQFKLFTGKTPTEFLTETRINHACYLIDIYKDTLALTEIAEKCGYTDYIYFSRRFKQFTGVSPKEYKSL
ncbi:MAG: helix-turn-helix transcriptional regulator [Oscillospiraceae bacterium]|nr:helix-turn-helix transcriptional regulator [Oscillospiraceae bacterium]